MRRKASESEAVRRRMVDAAARAFRRGGYAGVGVDALAAEAGVTSGAIYSQFGSKDGAFLAAMGGGLDQFVEAVPAFQREHGRRWLEAFADFYLGEPHRADLAGGCTIATLVPDVVRAASPDVRDLFAEKVRQVIDLMAAGLGGPSRTRRERAWATLSALVGGLNLLRAMPPSTPAAPIAAGVRRAVLATAGPISRARVTSSDPRASPPPPRPRSRTP